MEVDCSRESLLAAAGPILAESGADLQIGMRVTTPYGDGRIVGVARGDIWYALDSEGGKVWYWSREELEVQVGSGRVVLAPHGPGGEPSSTPSRGTSGAAGEDGTTAGSALERGQSLGNSLAPPGAPTPAAFAAQLTGASGWTAEMDDALVKLVNSASGRLGLPATHISYSDLEQALRTQAVGPLRSYLAQHALSSAFVRFAAILWLNRAVSTASPLVNLALPPERSIVMTEYDVEAAKEVVPSLGVGPTSPLGNTIASLRGSIFTSTKLALWNEVSSGTGQRTVTSLAYTPRVRIKRTRGRSSLSPPA